MNSITFPAKHNIVTIGNNIQNNKMLAGLWQNLLLSILILGVCLTGNAQICKDFTQRTSQYSPSKTVYHIQGDYTLIGNANMRSGGASDGGGNNNSSNVIYHNIDAELGTQNSTSAQLKYSLENGANPECTQVVYAGLYWTGRYKSGQVVPTTTTSSNNVHNNGHLLAYSISITPGTNSWNFVIKQGNTVIYNETIIRETYSRKYVKYSIGSTTLRDNIWESLEFNSYTFNHIVNLESVTSGNQTTQYQITAFHIDRNNPSNNYITIMTTTTEDIPSVDRRRVVKFRHQSGEYQTLIAAQNDIYYPETGSSSNLSGTSINEGVYVSYIEVTDLVRQYGEGNYYVADIQSANNASSDLGVFSGWTMVVVYENSQMKWRDITVFDGLAQVSSSNDVTIPISGFRTVQVGNVKIKLGMATAEGDYDISGDVCQIQKLASTSWQRLTNPVNNTTDNFFASSIYTGDGSTRNPSYNNNKGIDIICQNLPNDNNTILTNEQTSTKFRFTSSQDTYYPFLFVFGCDAYIPDARVVDAVVESNSAQYDSELDCWVTHPGDTITFIMKVHNYDDEDIRDAEVRLPLPVTIDYYSVSAQYSDGRTGTYYYDPSQGINGTSVWKVDYLPAGYPDSVWATFTLKCFVTKDCYVLASANEDCLLQLIVNGTLSGTSVVNNVDFTTEFIQGFQQIGVCKGNTISEDLVVVVDKNDYIKEHCRCYSSTEDNPDYSCYTSRTLNFCNSDMFTNGNVPFNFVSQYYPLGTRFYNATRTEEFTPATGFPSTYFNQDLIAAAPSALGDCISNVKVNAIGSSADEPADPTVISNTVTYCQGTTAQPLSTMIRPASTHNAYVVFFTVNPDLYSGANFEELPKMLDFTPSTVTVGTQNYWARQYSSSNDCYESNTYLITVNVVSPLIINSTFESPSCQGTAVNFTPTVTGGTFNIPVAQQSYFSVNGSVITLLSTAPAGTYSFTYEAPETTTDNGCPSSLTQTITHVILAASTGGNITPNPLNICLGSPVPDLTLNDYVGHVERWEYLKSGTDVWSVIPNNTWRITQADITELTVGTYEFRAYVKNGNCDAVWSDIATVTVLNEPAPTAPTITTPNFYCPGEEYTLAPSSTEYLWYASETGGTADPSLSSGTMGTQWIQRYISKKNNHNCESQRVLIEARPTFSAGKIAITGQTLCNSSTSTAVIGSTTDGVITTGTTGTISYQWQVSRDGGAFTDISGANSPTYTPTDRTDGTYVYRRLVRSADCNWLESEGTWTLNIGKPDATIVTEGGNTVLCNDGSILLKLAAGGSTLTYTYQWYKNGTTIAGATGATYTATTPGSYTVKVTHKKSGCEATTPDGNAVELTTDDVDPIIIAPASKNLGCNPTAVQKSTVPEFTCTDNGELVTIPAANITYSDVTSDCQVVRTWTATYTDACGNSDTKTTTYTWKEDNTNPVISTIPVTKATNINHCESFQIPNLSDYVLTHVSDNCSNTTSLTVAQTPTAGTAIAKGTTQAIVVTVTDGCGNTSTATVQIVAPKDPVVNLAASQSTICSGESTILSASASSTCTYSWDAPLLTATGSTATTAPTSTTTYTVHGTDANGCQGTGTATVTVLEPAVTLNAMAEQTICEGNDVTLLASTSSSNGTVTYAWTPTATLSAVTGASVTTTPTTTTTYQVVATATVTTIDKSCTATDDESITVNVLKPAVTLNNINNATNICNGSTVALSSTLNGTATGTVTYQWYQGTGASKSAIAGATTLNYTTPALTSNASYTLVATATVTENGVTCTTTDEKSIDLSVPAEIVVTNNVITNVLCRGKSTGAVTLNITGGTPGYSYAWSNDATTANLSNVVAGTYTVTVTDTKGCTGEGSATINQPESSVVIDHINKTDVTCKDAANGQASISATGGTLASGHSYNYLWSNSATTATITNLEPGNYYITITDDNGCEATGSTNIIEPELLALNIVQTNVSCAGGSNGSVNIAVTGGTTPYSYSWDNNTVTNPYIQGIAGGTYPLIVKDARGCIATQTIVVSEPEVFTIGASHINETCDGNDGKIIIQGQGGTPFDLGGTNPYYLYTWYKVNSATDSTVIATNVKEVANLAAGNYTIVAKDLNDCPAKAHVTVSLDNPLSINEHLSANPHICNGGSFSVVPQNGTDGQVPAGTLYSWDAPVVEHVSGTNAGVNQSSIHDEGIKMDITYGSTINVPYTITAKLGAKCENSTDVIVNLSVTLNGDVNITLTNVNVCPNVGTQDLTANLTNISYDYDITWNFNGNSTTQHRNATELNPTLNVNIPNSDCNIIYPYSVTIEDNIGCTNTKSGNVIVNIPVWNIGEEDGLSTIQCPIDAEPPTPPVVVDGCGNALTPVSIGFDPSTDELVTCNGTVVYSYKYTDCAGTAKTWSYTYRINDTTKPVITDCSSLNTTLTSTNCTFVIPDFETAVRANASDNCTVVDYIQTPVAGTVITETTNVTVSVKDACGNVSDSKTIVVTVPIAPSIPEITMTHTDVACKGDNTGSITVAASNGATPYKYLLNATENTTGVFSNLEAGSYTIKVTDGNGCEATTTAIVTEPAAALATSIPTPAPICIGATATLSANATGGTGTMSYNWSIVSGSAIPETVSSITVTPTATTNYKVVVTDANGCTAEATQTVIVNSLPVVSLETVNNLCPNVGSTSMTATLTTTSAAPYTYNWTDGTLNLTPATTNSTNSTSNTITVSNIPNRCSNSYTVNVRVTDNNGCQATASGLITTKDLTETPVLSVNSGVVVADGNLGCNPSTFPTHTAADFTVTGDECNSGTINVTEGAVIEGINCSKSKTWTANYTNACGISATSATITYTWKEDHTIPTINPTATQAAIAAGNCQYKIPDITAVVSANDDCNSTTLTITQSINANDTYDQTDVEQSIPVIITVIDECGNQATQTVNVTIPAKVSATATATPHTIYAGENSVISTNAISGATPYSYAWNNTAVTGTGNTVSPITTTTYTVTVTDNNGCQAIASTTVTVEAVATLAVTPQEQAVCKNTAITPMEISYNNATNLIVGTLPAGLTYDAVNHTISGTPTTVGSHDFTVEAILDPTNPIANKSVTCNVTVYALPAVVLGNQNICLGASVTLKPETSPGVTTYAWNTGASTNTITVVPTTNTIYSVTVTNGNNCQAHTNAEVIVNSLPNIVIATVEDLCPNVGNKTLTASVTTATTEPYNFVWSSTDLTLNSTTGTSIDATIPTTCNATHTVNVTMTDGHGCQANATQNIRVKNLTETPVISRRTGIDETNDLGCNPTVPTLTAADFNVSGDECNSGTLNVTYSKTSSTCNISQTWTANYTNICGVAADAVTVVYNWTEDTNIPTFTTIDDQNAVVSTSDCAYTIPNLSTIALAHVSDECSAVHFVEQSPIVGTGITMTTTEQTIPVIVKVADACNNEATTTINVKVPAKFTVDIAATPTTICQGETSTISITPNGGVMPHTYAWDNTAVTGTGNDVTPTTTTTYKVTVTDHIGCTVEKEVTVNVNALPTVTVNSENICLGQQTATLTATASTDVTSYIWSNHATTASITVSPSVATDYTVTVTNGNGCKANATGHVNIYPIPVVEIATVGNLCPNVGTTTLQATVTTATSAPYTYNWTGMTFDNATISNPTVTIPNICGGNNSVIVTIHDAHNCYAADNETFTTIDVTSPVIGTDNLDRTLTSTNCTFVAPNLIEAVRNISTDNCTAQADLIITQSPLPNTIFPQTVAVQMQTIIVTVKDACGNESTKNVTITIPAKLEIATTPAKQTTCSNVMTTIGTTVTGGTPAFAYTWGGTGISTASATTATAEVTLHSNTVSMTYNYTVNVKDVNNCEAEATAQITVKPAADGISNITEDLYCNNTAFDVVPTNGNIPAGTLFTWTVTNNANVDGESDNSTPVTSISQTLNNTTTVIQDVVYDVTPVTDDCEGNHFTLTVRVYPTNVITLNCPADIDITLNFGQCDTLLTTLGSHTVTYSNSALGHDYHITVSNDAPADRIFDVADHTITYTAVDECGNTATCNQHIIIRFPNCPVAIDADGNTYNSTRIGCDCWTTTNLKSEHYCDNSEIGDIYEYSSELYPNTAENVNIFGKLYSWQSAAKANDVGNITINAYGHVDGICPCGWYLPTDEKYLSLNAYPISTLKSPNYWVDGGGTNETGFTSIPSGFYDGSIDRYLNLYGNAYYWSVNEVGGTISFSCAEIRHHCDNVVISSTREGLGYSVRCIKERE